MVMRFGMFNIFEILLLVKPFALIYNICMNLEEKVACLLIQNRKTLAIAESCTGGLLANRLTNISGSSKFFKAGLVTYSNEAKMKCLNVARQVLQKYGAVSEQTCLSLAKNVRRLFNSDFGIGISGIAGPTGATKSKPIGLTYIALSTKDEIICLRCQFRGNRLQIKSQAASQALKLLLEFLPQR